MRKKNKKTQYKVSYISKNQIQLLSQFKVHQLHYAPVRAPQPQPKVEDEAFEEELQLDAELIPLLDQSVEVVRKLIFIIWNNIE